MVLYQKKKGKKQNWNTNYRAGNLNYRTKDNTKDEKDNFAVGRVRTCAGRAH